LAIIERPREAIIVWEGDSREVIGRRPKAMRQDFGLALQQMQIGKPPTLDSRSMASIGKGVYELKDSDDKTWYRMIYFARINDVIHVLHCFEKDSRKTDKRDIKLATTRLAEVNRRLTEERRDAKHKGRK
jgi:phage-related protein